MVDEAAVLARLDSPVYGAMLQAVSVSGRAIDSNASAIRILDGEGGPLSACADVSGLGLPHNKTKNLCDWPGQQDLLFDYARRCQLLDHDFRPLEILGSTTRAESQLMAAIESLSPVTDIFCVTFPILDAAWCIMVYLRCGAYPTFSEVEAQSLIRFKPAIAKLVRQSYLRQARPRSPEESVATSTPRLTTDQALAKLSQTERQIFQHLLLEVTERHIAQEIHRSPHTVHVHVKNIYRKLGVASRRQLQALIEDHPS